MLVPLAFVAYTLRGQSVQAPPEEPVDVHFSTLFECNVIFCLGLCSLLHRHGRCRQRPCPMSKTCLAAPGIDRLATFSDTAPA